MAIPRKSLHCDISKGGLGIIDFEVKCHTLRIALLVSSLEDQRSKCFYLVKYLCSYIIRTTEAYEYEFKRDFKSVMYNKISKGGNAHTVLPMKATVLTRTKEEERWFAQCYQ